MKKILFAIAIVLTIGFSANAQGRDGFFSSYDNGYSNREVSDPTSGDFNLNFPNHFETNDNGAPLGSGLLVLTALGAGYAVYRKRKKINKNNSTNF